MEQLIDFHVPEVQAVLDTLLKDKSTGKNIIWATDPPEELQTVMYEPVTDRSQITTQQLRLTHYEVVLPRMMKQTDTQQQRTRKKGEVFSPAWVCNKMNNALDADWFRGLGAGAAHPESRCVASGGQNDNEPISEAACIRNTLAARGIDPDRILLEDRSRSTEENLRFTAEIIRQQGLNPRVAIASDNFHQLRASVWARRCGLEAESLGCASWWPLGPGYWAREAVAVVVLEVGSLLQGG